jgi:hypothetical protein
METAAKPTRRVCLCCGRGDRSTRPAVLEEPPRGIPGFAAVLDGELCFPAPKRGAGLFPIAESCFYQPRDGLETYAFEPYAVEAGVRHPRGLNTGNASSAAQAPRRAASSVETIDDGQKLLATNCIGLEGIVGKRQSASYRPGECGEWVQSGRQHGARAIASDGRCWQEIGPAPCGVATSPLVTPRRFAGCRRAVPRTNDNSDYSRHRAHPNKEADARGERSACHFLARDGWTRRAVSRTVESSDYSKVSELKRWRAPDQRHLSP